MQTTEEVLRQKDSSLHAMYASFVAGRPPPRIELTSEQV